MNKDEIKKDEIKRGLKCCSAVAFKASCSDCSYVYRCRDLCKDALDLITEQEKEIERLIGERNQGVEIIARLCNLSNELLKEYEK